MIETSKKGRVASTPEAQDICDSILELRMAESTLHVAQIAFESGQQAVDRMTPERLSEMLQGVEMLIAAARVRLEAKSG